MGRRPMQLKYTDRDMVVAFQQGYLLAVEDALRDAANVTDLPALTAAIGNTFDQARRSLAATLSLPSRVDGLE